MALFGGGTSLTRASQAHRRTVGSAGRRGGGGRWQGRGLIGTPVGSRLRGSRGRLGTAKRAMTGGQGGFVRPGSQGGRARLPQRETLYEKRMGGRELKLEFGSRARSHMYAGKRGETYTASTFRLGPKDLQARPTTRKLGWREKVTIADVPGGGVFQGESGVANPRHAFMAKKNRRQAQRQYEAAVDAPMKFPE